MAEDQLERVIPDAPATRRWLSPWRGLGWLALIGIALLILFGTAHRRAASEPEATQGLLYLKTAVRQVAWDEVTSAAVYIGLSSRPETLREIVGTAALSGNQATGDPYTAWALDAGVAQLGWRPGDPGLICSATASDGRITSNDCQSPKTPSTQ